MSRVAIVGAGFSGTALALQLLRRATASGKGPLDVTLVEREPRQLARGVAYSSFDPRHILNVPAAQMSFDPAAPDDFVAWLRARGLAPREAPGEWFAPRQLYGQYLEQRLRDSEAAAADGARLRRVTGEAVDARPAVHGWQLLLRGGELVVADALVLALGNFPPPHPVVRDPQGYDSPRYFNRAWEPGAVDGLEPDDAVLLIGTGLTSVDMLVSLTRNGHHGAIHAVSRRGLWPFPHEATPVWPEFVPGEAPHRIATLLALVRAELAKAAAAGVPWPSVINALRPRTVALWQALPRSEQQRFLRHVRPWWEVARHRMPPSSSALVAELTARGQLTTLRGRLRSIEEDEGLGGAGLQVGIQLRGAEQVVLRAARVLNCTGAESNYRKLADPLVRNLMRHGLAHADPLHLGLATDADGRLEDAQGATPHPLYTLGPCRKGSLWETTAVPEIRGQAAALAAVLLGR